MQPLTSAVKNLLAGCGRVAYEERTDRVRGGSMTRWWRSTALRIAAWALCAVPAAADEPRKHDPGVFFFRFSVGAGTANVRIEPSGFESTKFHGPTVDLDLAAGVTVRENLALHVTSFGWNMTNPNLVQPRLEGRYLGNIVLACYGVGATWYFTKSNLYLTGSAGVGQLKFDLIELSVRDRSEYGPAFTLGAGKEWWLGESFALGMSASFAYVRAQDSTVPESWAGPGFGLRASMSYN